MNFIESIDQTLFRFINQTLSNPVFDIFMPFITNQNVFGIPIAIAALAGLIFGDKRTKFIMLGGILAVGLGDQISSGVMKPFFGQYRPCKELSDLVLRINCGGRLSFPSGHATGTMILALWFGYHYKKWMPYFLTFALIISFSRVYVGVHWTSDVLGGMLLGYIIVKSFIYIWESYIIPKLSSNLTIYANKDS
ncbi:MAG: phosphatase PAP2 family protein [Candidatus Marinimicrobia bacterium]|nr:phosphatase PAP2 family protein [Candidatus Neomarinimicrobiota bacterium]